MLRNVHGNLSLSFPPPASARLRASSTRHAGEGREGDGEGNLEVADGLGEFVCVYPTLEPVSSSAGRDAAGAAAAATGTLGARGNALDAIALGGDTSGDGDDDDRDEDGNEGDDGSDGGTAIGNNGDQGGPNSPDWLQGRQQNGDELLDLIRNWPDGATAGSDGGDRAGLPAWAATAAGNVLDGQLGQLVQAMATYSAGNSAFDHGAIAREANDAPTQGTLAAAWS